MFRERCDDRYEVDEGCVCAHAHEVACVTEVIRQISGHCLPAVYPPASWAAFQYPSQLVLPESGSFDFCNFSKYRCTFATYSMIALT